MIVKVFLTLNVDEEEYPIPVDGDIEQEINESLEGHIYDIDGITIKSIKILTE